MQEILSSHKKVKGSVAKQLYVKDDKPCYIPLGPLRMESFDKEECNELTSLFSRIQFPNCTVKCLRLHRVFQAILYDGRALGSLSSQRIKSSSVFSKYGESLRLCQIQHFCEVTVSITNNDCESKLQTYLVAVVSWYRRHPEQNWFSKPALVFCKFFEPLQSFIFIDDIECIAATCNKTVKLTYGEESVLCVVPLEPI